MAAATRRSSAKTGTKDKIYRAVREQLAHTDIAQITVQDIMLSLGMRRQSFYYHFIDIYDVLEWSVSEHFCKKLVELNSDSFENWLRQALSILRDNQNYVRKIAGPIPYERLSDLIFPVVEPKLRQLLAQKYEGADNLGTLSHLMTYCVLSSFYTLILRNESIDVEHHINYVREAVHALGLVI